MSQRLLLAAASAMKATKNKFGISIDDLVA